MPEYKQNAPPSEGGLAGSSEEVRAAVTSLQAEADDAETRLRERLLRDAEQKIADSQEPGEA